jgi:hypothetical protein
VAADRTQSAPLSLTERLKAYGCGTIISLDQPLAEGGPEQLDYLDLLPRSGTAAAASKLLSAVVENQNSALLYVIDADGEKPVPAARLAEVQQALANRSEPAWLGICRPGWLDIYPIGLRADGTERSVHTIRADAAEAPLFFQSLVHATFEAAGAPAGADYVSQRIFDLLTQTTNEFVPQRVLDPLDILSMAGRALFFRFLIDRRIVRSEETSEICRSAKANDLKGVFSSAEKAAQTSAWLDETFNGDFLRLIDEDIPADDREARERAYRKFYREVGQKTEGRFFGHLHAILNGFRSTGEGFQGEFDWDDFNFAHIPVGVLSQVYENFSHLVDEPSAKVTSVHYTPRLVAELMVNQTFGATPEARRAEAKVLDPACGAGIFLVLAFRRLVRDRWQRDGVRPNTAAIQDILYQQLRGFDVSEAALRLAALSLYITAIEVNGTPWPPKSLRFPKSLRDRVLFNVRDNGAAGSGFVLGSLGDRAPKGEDGTFDIVIGNPPWTRLREAELQRADGAARKTEKAESAKHNDAFSEIARRVLRARGFAELAADYANPDKNPDLPFVWRAIEWAKPNGLIAFALHPRIFLRSAGKSLDTWHALLRSVQLTGIVNGADLRKTDVWAGMDAPFCLFFARNAAPSESHRFYFTPPVKDTEPNKQGRFRIDYEATRAVSVERVLRQPWLLKTLSLGTWRDVEVMESIFAAFPQTLEQFWEICDPCGEQTGLGYNLSARLKQKPAQWLGDLPVIELSEDIFSIPYAELRTFRSRHGRSSAHMPRTEALYQAPLVIVPKAPGEDTRTAKAYLSDRALAFSQSFYGYSCAGHPEAATLSALLYLVPHSTLFRYFSLMYSVSQGVDYMMFTKTDLDSLPFPDVSRLPAATKASLSKLAHQLEHAGAKPWDEIDALLFKLYGLDDEAQQTIKDTLFAAAAYRRQGREALERTTRDYRAPFLQTLQTLLAPYFEVCGQRLSVAEPENQPDDWGQPWHFVSVARAGETIPISAALLRRAMQEANRSAASRIVVNAPGGKGLLLGLLNQKRWWTVSRGRLCGQHLLREHLDVFGLARVA